MKEYNSLQLVKNLPDAFAKSENSNNYKLFQIIKKALSDLDGVLSSIYNTLDINLDVTDATDEEKALFNETLNLYGAMFNQPRGAMNDEQYRSLIKSKIMQNLCDGTCSSVINAICNTFSSEPEDLKITESETDCSVKVEGLPISAITTAGFSISQAAQIIKRLVPAGVALECAGFDGTFEFVSIEPDMKPAGDNSESEGPTGFTDTEANMKNESAKAGYFGALYEGEDIALPI